MVCDELTLKNPFDHGKYSLSVDFQVNKSDIKKWKQFCFAKGIYGSSIDWMKDNPYIGKGEK